MTTKNGHQSLNRRVYVGIIAIKNDTFNVYGRTDIEEERKQELSESCRLNLQTPRSPTWNHKNGFTTLRVRIKIRVYILTLCDAKLSIYCQC